LLTYVTGPGNAENGISESPISNISPGACSGPPPPPEVKDMDKEHVVTGGGACYFQPILWGGSAEFTPT